MKHREGVTLVELLVVIVILTIVMGLSSVALRRIDASPTTDAEHELLALRRDAIRTGAPATRVVHRGANMYVVTALADGRVLSDSTMHTDPNTGADRDAAK
jgi:prepilin-type N-terminal cleavage/methylation domain-containing protein